MKKNYYAIIPANVRYDKDLKANAKLLYGEITALTNEKGFCWASNSYFAELYEVSKETISRWISHLSDKGYVTVEIVYKEGTKQIVNRYIRISHGGHDQNVNTPIDQNVKGNTTVINNTSNTTLDKVPYVEIINYLNDVSGKKYRHSTSSTKKLIKARMKEKFTVDDFKKVIDTKSNEWKNDPKMSKFIRPDTLFGTKFEGYLNQETKSSGGYDPNRDAF